MSQFKRHIFAGSLWLALPCLLIGPEGFFPAQQQAAPFEIRLPPEIRSEQVQYVYHLMGPSLNFSSLGRTEPERNSYLIPTVIDHHTADKLQVILYASGCQMVTFDVRLPAPVEQTTEMPCADLPPMAFHGRVEMPETLRRRPYDITIGYLPSWQNDFFHFSGGPAAEFRLGLVTPDERGAFDVQLPNFSKDAVTESYRRNAWIRFAAVEHDSGNRLCLLTPANLQGRDSKEDLPIQSKYPKEVVLRPRAEPAP